MALIGSHLALPRVLTNVHVSTHTLYVHGYASFQNTIMLASAHLLKGFLK